MRVEARDADLSGLCIGLPPVVAVDVESGALSVAAEDKAPPAAEVRHGGDRRFKIPQMRTRINTSCESLPQTRGVGARRGAGR
jgi:hypothetical protein